MVDPLTNKAYVDHGADTWPEIAGYVQQQAVLIKKTVGFPVFSQIEGVFSKCSLNAH